MKIKLIKKIFNPYFTIEFLQPSLFQKSSPRRDFRFWLKSKHRKKVGQYDFLFGFCPPSHTKRSVIGGETRCILNIFNRNNSFSYKHQKCY